MQLLPGSFCDFGYARVGMLVVPGTVADFESWGLGGGRGGGGSPNKALFGLLGLPPLPPSLPPSLPPFPPAPKIKHVRFPHGPIRFSSCGLRLACCAALRLPQDEACRMECEGIPPVPLVERSIGPAARTVIRLQKWLEILGLTKYEAEFEDPFVSGTELGQVFGGSHRGHLGPQKVPRVAWDFQKNWKGQTLHKKSRHFYSWNPTIELS